MMRVLALGRSMPVSMMVVHTSTFSSPSVIRLITSSMASWVILPWATPTAASSPSMAWMRLAVRSMVSTRLWR